MALIKTFIDAFVSSFKIVKGLKTRHFYNIAQSLLLGKLSTQKGCGPPGL